MAGQGIRHQKTRSKIRRNKVQASKYADEIDIVNSSLIRSTTRDTTTCLDTTRLDLPKGTSYPQGALPLESHSEATLSSLYGFFQPYRIVELFANVAHLP